VKTKNFSSREKKETERSTNLLFSIAVAAAAIAAAEATRFSL